MTRRTFLGSLFGSALVYPCYLEPRWLDLTGRRVRLQTPLAHPVRILQLSDLHASLPVPLSMIHHAITAGLAKKPDLICLTGDFITYHQDFSAAKYAATLRRLSSFAPTFAVLGNHDGGGWAAWHNGNGDHRLVDRILEDGEVELLHNRSAQVEVRGARLNLVGVGDLWSDEVDGRRAFADARPGQPTVLLAHNPDTKSEVRRHPWDLMLSGHTHGGQVIVGFDGAKYAPVKDKRYVAGLKSWGTRQIHVSRGVGNVGGVRFRCRPEATVLTVA
jgi:predicted MPP superfamily phosphohydrolase